MPEPAVIPAKAGIHVPRWRAILGICVGGFLLLSSVFHSVLGGAAMKAEMAKAHVPDDLGLSLYLGWVWGGFAMVAFGAIAIMKFKAALRGETVAMTPVRWIAAAYLAFGIWAFVMGNFEWFFLIMFATPGVLLGVAASGSTSR